MTKRVLAILGDFYHEEKLSKRSFEHAIEQLNQVEVEYATVKELVDKLKTKPDVVVLFAENRLNPQEPQVETWMDEGAAKAINSYVNEGGGWIAWHSGLASYEQFEDYTTVLKGYFKYHPADHQVVTYFERENMGLNSNEETFSFLDEHYFVYCDEENTNVFLKSESVDGTSIAGWEHKFGKGQVVCFTPAHREEGLLHPTTVKLLANAIKLSANIGE